MLNLKLSRRTLRESPTVVQVSLAGEVEVTNGLQAEQYFDRMLEEDQPVHVLLDLSGLSFASSVFFSALLFWREALTRRHGRLVLHGLRPEIANTMRILALDRVLTVCPDQSSALETVSRV